MHNIQYCISQCNTLLDKCGNLSYRLVNGYEKPYAVDQSLYILIDKDAREKSGGDPSLLYLLGVLSSVLGVWFIRTKYSIFDKIHPWYTKHHLDMFPIPSVSSANGAARHDKMVKLVQRMLDLHKRLQTAKTDHERTLMQRRIAATDDEIDRLVYALYGLTDEEIAIVEESVKE